jgi:hypothetical protein
MGAMHHRRLLEGLVLILAASGCAAPSPESPETAGSGALDCASPVSYDGKKVAGDFAIGQIFGGGGSYEETSLRDPGEKVENYYAGLNRLCKEFNAGVLDKLEYRKRADALTQGLFADFAPDGTQKAKFAEVYEGLLGSDVHGTPLQLEFNMLAEVPGESPFVVRPNQPVPTGAKVYFTVQVNQPAQLYVFQKTERNGVTALFPHPQMQLANPLRPGQAYRIPPGATQQFAVNVEDVGTENVYLLASLHELPDVSAALARMANEQGDPSLSQFQALEPLAQLAPGASQRSCTRALVLENTAAPCSRTRGLVLVGAADNVEVAARPTASLVVRADPGDATIVKVFPWRHVMVEDLATARAQYEAPDESGRRTRGVLVE